MSIIYLPVGNGLGFVDSGTHKDKLTTRIVVSDYIAKKSDGLYVPSLKGKDGKDGGSVADGHTIYESSASKIDTVRNNVQLIFSMCAYTVATRANPLVFTSTIKNVKAIIDEINYPLGYNGTTSYHPVVGELFQLLSTGAGRYTAGTYTEDCNRYSGTECLALFYIPAITYQPQQSYKVKSLTLHGLYIDDRLKSVYPTVDQDYSYSY